MLVSRGHRLRDILSDYPISTVMALSKAASQNRIYETVAMSGAVAAGAVHAIEAGFSGKTPKALKNYQKAMLTQAKKLAAKGQGVQSDADTLLGGFGGLGAAQKRQRRGEHRD